MVGTRVRCTYRTFLEIIPHLGLFLLYEKNLDAYGVFTVCFTSVRVVYLIKQSLRQYEMLNKSPPDAVREGKYTDDSIPQLIQYRHSENPSGNK